METTTETTMAPSQSLIDDISRLGDDFILRVFNNDTTTFTEVVMVLALMIPCDVAYAQSCAVQIDSQGSSEVMKSTFSHCEQVKEALLLIKVKSEILSALD